MTPDKMAQIILKDPAFSEVTSEVQEARLFKVMSVTKQSEGIYSVSARLTVSKYGDPPQAGGGGGGSGGGDGGGGDDGWVEPPIVHTPDVILSADFSELVFDPILSASHWDNTKAVHTIKTKVASRQANVGVVVLPITPAGSPLVLPDKTISNVLGSESIKTVYPIPPHEIRANFETRRPLKGGSLTITLKMGILELVGDGRISIDSTKYGLQMWVAISNTLGSSIINVGWLLPSGGQFEIPILRPNELTQYMRKNVGKFATIQLIFDAEKRYFFMLADGDILASTPMAEPLPEGIVGLEQLTPTDLMNDFSGDFYTGATYPCFLSSVLIENGVHPAIKGVDPYGSTVAYAEFKEMTYDKEVTDAFKPAQFICYLSPAIVVSRAASNVVIYTGFSATPETNKLMPVSVPAIVGTEVVNALSPRVGQGMLAIMDARRPLMGGSLVLTAKMGFLRSNTSGVITVMLQAADFTLNLTVSIRATGSILTSRWVVESGSNKENVFLPMVVLDNLSEYLRANYGKFATVKVIFDGVKKLCTVTADGFVVAQVAMTHPHMINRLGLEESQITQMMARPKPDVTAQALYPCVLASLKLENSSENASALPPLPPPPPPPEITEVILDVDLDNLTLDSGLTSAYQPASFDVYTTACKVASRNALVSASAQYRAVDNISPTLLPIISMPLISGGSIQTIGLVPARLFNLKVDTRLPISGNKFTLKTTIGFTDLNTTGTIQMILAAVNINFNFIISPTETGTQLICQWLDVDGKFWDLAAPKFDALYNHLKNNLGKLSKVALIFDNLELKFYLVAEGTTLMTLTLPAPFPTVPMGQELRTPLENMAGNSSDVKVSVSQPCIMAQLRLENTK